MTTDRPVGAYGFRLEGAGQHLLLPVGDDWPSIRLAQEIFEPREGARLEIGDDRATVPLLGGGFVEVERRPPAAIYKLPHQLSEDEIAHPYLGPVAALHAHWLGRQNFHGGAMVIGDRAWGVIGRREAGKSTLLAEADRRGIAVLADDLLIVDGGDAFAGPRSLDLRETAAEHFGAGRPLGVVGRRERWRIDLGPVAVRVPLAGWIFLRWGSVPLAGHVAVRERLSWLAANRTVKIDSSDPAALLRLASLPAVELTGLQRWESLAPLFEDLLVAIDRLETPA